MLLEFLLIGWTGIVMEIHDGDTLKIQPLKKEETATVRLLNIDAPELKQNHGFDAKYHLGVLCGCGDKVNVRESKERDVYGRTLAVVSKAGHNINYLMVKDGYAWAFTRYLKGSDKKKYTNAEYKAKIAGLGLWDEKDPVAPWDFRKEAKEHGSK